MLNLWEPIADFDRFARAFDRGQANRPAAFAPAVDIVDGEGHFLLHAELPGVAEEDITLEFEDGILTLKGERKLEKEEGDGKRYHRVERSYGAFVRRFNLPDNVDATAIQASLEKGVLEIKVPKKAETAPRRISVNAA